MADTLGASLAAIGGRPELAALRRGIEKESLRLARSGELAQTPHPQALGSPLTHPRITTDFSEAQLELITGVRDSADAVLRELADIHRFVAAGIDGELLWAASMPCILGGEESIPVARFGTSNAGRSKTVYRMGLVHRYGRMMQTISGIHYNFSVPDALWAPLAAQRGEDAGQDFRNRAYFGLIRNFRRHSWLLIYLFGASPAVCRSFLPRAGAGLEALDEGTLHLPHATSLRMGRLGYQSDAQSSLHISYNSLPHYAGTMREALTAPYPPYEAIGVKSPDGEYRQLSTALLQIENEFYGAIRPKRRARSGERPLDALHARGVEYVEVRCLDLDPFQPIGIDADTCRFLDAFLLFCLLDDAPPDDRAESEAMLRNQLRVVERGREPDLALLRHGSEQSFAAWSGEILEHCARVAEAIDAVAGSDLHQRAVAAQRDKVAHPEHTPSGRVLDQLRGGRQSFLHFAMERSLAHRRWFDAHPLDAECAAAFGAQSEQSLRDQAQAEAADTESFDAYLQRYLKLAAAS